MDDSLTSLDSQVQEYIFNECIKKFLKTKICVLVTQNVNQINAADSVVIMDDSNIKSFGSPNEKIIGEVNKVLTQENSEKSIDEEVQIKTKVSSDDEFDNEETNLLEETEQTNKKKVYAELIRKGKVSLGIYKEYLLYGGGTFILLLNMFFFTSAQGADSFSDYILAKW